MSITPFAQRASRGSAGTNLPAGYWPPEKSRAILDKTQTITLSPDLSRLSGGERTALVKLLEVGRIFQNLYEQQRHAQALASHRALRRLGAQLGSPPATQDLLALYYLNQGPVA
ncbi:MAG: NUDIX hydrolase, partial [Pyrinomonadaceae bacterium]